MILLGYEFKEEFVILRQKNGLIGVNPNLIFNANHLYRDEMQCECGMTYVRDQKRHHLKSKKHQKEMVKKHTTPAEPFSLPVDSMTGQVV